MYIPNLQLAGAAAAHDDHGSWELTRVWMNVGADWLLTLVYFMIPAVLLYFILKHRNSSVNWIFRLFGAAIAACAVVNAGEVWSLWRVGYGFAGGVKAVTAIFSIGAALYLGRLMRQVLLLPSIDQWMEKNRILEQEVQERRGLEMQLRLSEANYRETAALVDLTHDAIFVRNMKDEIIYWNRAAEALYGWRRDEVIGQTTHSLLRTIFPKPLEEIEAEILSQGMWEGELTHHCKDGSITIVSSRWALNSKDGQPRSILESNRDISHRKEEEQKFRSFLEAAPDAVVIADEQGKMVLVNSQTEQMFGYPRGELLGQAVEMLLPQDLRAGHFGHRAAYHEHPKVRSMGADLELHGLRKGGAQFPVEISLSPLKTKSGMLVSASVRDITERKRAEEALQQSDEKLRLLVRGVRDYAILMLDPEGHITTWNEGAERIKGYRPEEIIGQHFSKFYTPEDLASGKPEWELKIATSTGRFEEEGWRVRKDGSLFFANVVITPLRDKGGRLRGFGKVTRDISARKMAEEELARQRNELGQKNAQLQLANQELESFSYSVSHDLRSPLRTIDGFSHALLEDCGERLDEEGKSYLKRIRSATQRMGQLIDDLLSLSRLSRTPMHEQQLDLSALVNNIAAELQRADPERHVEVRVAAGMRASGDAGLLRIALENLLGNAWKFTSKKRDARIEFGTETDEDGAAFFLRDDGAGFDPQYADRLFGAFQRLHAVSEFEGTGIGLATVQRIIHRHGGRIWAKSKPGQGATFYFTLKQSAAEEARVELQNNTAGGR